MSDELRQMLKFSDEERETLKQRIKEELEETTYTREYDLLDSTAELMRAGGQLDEVLQLRWNDYHKGVLSVGYEEWFHGELKLRETLLKEELTEYLTAVEDGNLVEAVDGALDIAVIAWGTALKLVGIQKAYRAQSEVARSNQTKVDGSLGPIVKREDGKILKPEGWTPPDIAGVIA